MNKNFVSLQETISYLQFIKNDEKAFDGKQFIPSNENDQSESYRNRKIIKRPKKKQKLDLQDNEDHRKNINKNRAIKRIIQTSKQILEKNYQFVEKPPAEKQSYVTQMNIYLKQYNRLSDQIYKQEKQKEDKKRRAMEEEQEKLEQVYNYIVCTDFRQILEVAVVKEKISKNNINFMMDMFRKALVVVNTKDLKVYNGENEDNQPKVIKLFEIDNVDYHTQPYIFTVFTITRDKTQGQEFLYFKFNSIQNQDKWDRAIYCNYMSRKMKVKNRYFQIDYPVKEDEKREKDRERNILQRQEDFQEYEINRQKIINKICNIRNREISHHKTASIKSSHRDQKDSLHFTDSKGNVFSRNNSDLEKQDMKHSERKMRTKTETMGNRTPSRQNTNHHTFSNNDSRARQFTKKETGHLQEVEQMDRSEFEHSRRPHNNNSSNGQDQKLSKIEALSIKQGESEKDNEQGQQNIFNSEKSPSRMTEKQSKLGIMKSENINPSTKRKVELKEKYEEGIVMKKSKFFGDKSKIFYLNNSQLEYWDFNPKTFHKEEKKIIKISEIKKFKMDYQTKSITFYLKNKSLMFLGNIEQIKELIEWMELCKEDEMSDHKSLKIDNNK